MVANEKRLKLSCFIVAGVGTWLLIVGLMVRAIALAMGWDVPGTIGVLALWVIFVLAFLESVKLFRRFKRWIMRQAFFVRYLFAYPVACLGIGCLSFETAYIASFIPGDTLFKSQASAMVGGVTLGILLITFVLIAIGSIAFDQPN